MNILRARMLNSRRSVLDRFLFRLLWCFAGAAVVFAVFPAVIRDQGWFLIGAIIAVSALGAAADSHLLNYPQTSVPRLRVAMAAAIFLGLMTYFFIIGRTG